MRSAIRAQEIIAEAIDKYRPVAVYTMFSGGHDSLTSTHLAMQLKTVQGVAHINTGFGIEETREFVRETAMDRQWAFKEYWAKDEGYSYEDLAIQHGFPGPIQHWRMYAMLKERCIRSICRQAKVGQRPDAQVMLITGARKDEGIIRMGYVEPIFKEPGLARIWVAPIFDWTKSDITDYLAENQIKRSPVVDILHISGECLCGAYAKPGEREEIMRWFPKTGKRILELEAKVWAAGHHWKWGEIPPHTLQEADDPNQLWLFQPLCAGCPNKRPSTGITGGANE